MGKLRHSAIADANTRLFLIINHHLSQRQFFYQNISILIFYSSLWDSPVYIQCDNQIIETRQSDDFNKFQYFSFVWIFWSCLIDLFCMPENTSKHLLNLLSCKKNLHRFTILSFETLQIVWLSHSPSESRQLSEYETIRIASFGAVWTR